MSNPFSAGKDSGRTDRRGAPGDDLSPAGEVILHDPLPAGFPARAKSSREGALNGIRRRLAALLVGVAALVPTVGVTPANAIFFAGTCQLKVIVHFSEAVGFGTIGNPAYWIEVDPLAGGVKPCQLTDTLLDPLRNTAVTASGTSALFDCDSAVADGGWSQSWIKSNGLYSPAPVTGGSHKLYGTWDSWVLESEGTTAVRYASVMLLTLDPSWATQDATKCATGDAYELHMIGMQVFQDPEV